MSEEVRQKVWLLWCYWDKPYVIENQYNLLGVFTSEELAERYAEKHREYAKSSRGHADLDCEAYVESATLDEYTGD